MNFVVYIHEYDITLFPSSSISTSNENLLNPLKIMFVLIDYVLLTFGVMVYTEHRYLRALNYLFRYLYFISLVYELFISFKNGLSGAKLNMLFEYYVYFFLAISSQILVARKANSIRQLNTYLMQIADIEVKQKLRRYAFCLFMFHWFCTTLGIVAWFYNIVAHGLEARLENNRGYFFWIADFRLGLAVCVIMRNLIAGIAREQWIHNSAIVYIYFAVAIELIKHRSMSRLLIEDNDEHHNNHYHEKQLKKLIVIKRYFDRLKMEFESIFSVFPLMWFSYLFIGASGNIAYSAQNLQDPEMYAFLALFVRNLLVSFVIVFLINSFDYTNQVLCFDKCSTLFNELSNARNDEIAAITATQIELGRQIAYTGGGLFQLTSGFILSFVSGLVTFTVMFVQMS